MPIETDAFVLSEAHFETIRTLVRGTAGIDLRDGKQALVRSRVQKRLRALGLFSFDAYMERLDADATGLELRALVDVLTTNKTSFFREPAHYDYLRDQVLPELAAEGRPLRLWSAGCSSGEEPYHHRHDRPEYGASRRRGPHPDPGHGHLGHDPGPGAVGGVSHCPTA